MRNFLMGLAGVVGLMINPSLSHAMVNPDEGAPAPIRTSVARPSHAGLTGESLKIVQVFERNVGEIVARHNSLKSDQGGSSQCDALINQYKIMGGLLMNLGRILNPAEAKRMGPAFCEPLEDLKKSLKKFRSVARELDMPSHIKNALQWQSIGLQESTIELLKRIDA